MAEKAAVSSGATSAGRTPAAASAPGSSNLAPSIHSIVSTRFDERRGSVAGTCTAGQSEKKAAHRAALRASARKSSSSRATPLNSSMIQPAHKSDETCRATSGYWTLTATCSPPATVTARCTWAREAAATGCSSNTENKDPSGAPSSDSIVCRTSESETAGARSWQAARTRGYSGGSATPTVRPAHGQHPVRRPLVRGRQRRRVLGRAPRDAGGRAKLVVASDEQAVAEAAHCARWGAVHVARQPQPARTDRDPSDGWDAAEHVSPRRDAETFQALIHMNCYI
eukprot:scaffold297_cov108-Isochrysis_galbana.AAC.7